MKSSPKDLEYSVIFAPEAEADVFDILQFTLEEWELQQAEKYRAVLDKAFSAIRHSLQLGHKRHDIPPEYRAFQAGQHVIGYFCLTPQKVQQENNMPQIQ